MNILFLLTSLFLLFYILPYTSLISISIITVVAFILYCHRFYLMIHSDYNQPLHPIPSLPYPPLNIRPRHTITLTTPLSYLI